MSTGTDTSFGAVGIADIRELRALGTRVMGSDELSFPAEVLEGWLARNPEIIQAARVRGQMAGYAIILPLPDDVIDRVVRRALRPRAIAPELVRSYGPGESALYVAEMVIDQELPERSIAAAVLVRHWVRFFADKARHGFHATAMWCVGASEKGIEFARRLGCKEVHIEGVSCSEWVAMSVSASDPSHVQPGRRAAPAAVDSPAARREP
jgi:hypothetical protein